MIIDVLQAQSSGSLQFSLWKQERILLYVSNVQSPTLLWTDLHGEVNSPIARYLPMASHELYIDVTDYVRTYPNVTKIHVYSVQRTDIVLDVNVVGLINPAHVIIPPHWEYAQIIPPDYMIGNDSALGIAAEFYNYEDGLYSVSGATWESNYRRISISSANWDLNRTGIGTSAKTKKYRMRALQCDVDYMLVKWVSFTGVTRQHIFEIAKKKTEVENAFSLLPVDNEYVEIKGRKDGMTLRLAGLSAYDLWYYADVISSSNVQVKRLSDTEWDRVQVTSKNITIPDGEGGDGELEININWRRYDAVAM